MSLEVRTVPPDELATAPPTDLEEALERGAIVVFPPGSIPLPSAGDLEFLRQELGRLLSLKNISYHPEGDYLTGIQADAQERERTRRILCEHNRAVEAFLSDLLPDYSADWRAGKVNFRPLQEQGRTISRHSSNELIHVDAFASGATHGGRTLRFFTNVHPSEARVWKSAGLFPELFREFRDRAGIRPGPRGLREGVLGRTYSGLLHGLARAGLPQALTVDTSPYDRAMRRMHNTLKDDDAFQGDESRQTTAEFAPFSSWMVLTDMVSHACVSGQHAIVNTWTVQKDRLQRPELAPIAVMSGAE